MSESLEQKVINSQFEENGMFGFGKKDPSRREFLKGMGKTGIAAAASTVPFLSDKAHAFDEASVFPPGIANCRDRMVRLIYGALSGHYNLGSNYSLFERLTARIGIKREQVDFNSFYLEPAIYFVREEMGGRMNGNDLVAWNKLKERNPSLYFFQRGIGYYFDRWIHNDKRVSTKEIEDNLTKSIFYAAYPNNETAESKSQEFINGNLVEKTQLSNFLMNEFSAMKGLDQKSKNPSNPYNRMLVASWASFLLANHYDVRVNNWDIGKIINHNIEIPLRKFVPKIRGPPYYHL